MNQIAQIDEKIIWWKWRFGLPPEPYTEFQVGLFKELIKELNLNSIDIEIAAPEMKVGGMQVRSLELSEARHAHLIKRIKFPGGIIGPHFHFEGKIFLLDEKQWQRFSGTVVKAFQERLSSAGTINLEQFAKLNETLTAL
ncbi:hypothetical protein OU798_04750 [Prolixibacteraceae bacterium Z1-6]|uniref:Uncharacterized protein n=1 Tax=Draconibacterium aestuarii TaxID=2998507 RepID=A0A9X3J583_9BACT|nr:hypothetical protein [Prolixibacteraceae bacterium Z1-6]